ncbi:MAG: HNH endonuclease, partial [Gammaproteobacteria bacterium]
MTQLLLSVSRASMRVIPSGNHGTRSDTQLADAREDVLGQARFVRRCVFCDYQFGRLAEECEVHHFDGDHGNNSVENLAPACAFCHAAVHLELVSKRWPDSPGQMIWLPELTQSEVSSLCQAIVFACAMQQAQEHAPGEVSTLEETTGLPITPYTIYRRLSARTAQVESTVPGAARIRQGMGSPATFARVLQAMSPEDYERRGDLFAGVRYLPPLDPFLGSAKLWPVDGGAFSHLDLGSWGSIGN